MSNPKSKAQTGKDSPSSRQSRPKPEGYEALPRRFKDYIAAIESELSALQQTMDAEGETRVTLETYSRTGASRYLPNDARILFALTEVDGRRSRVEVQMDRRRGTAGISISSPDGRLVVLPEASNEIGVRVRDI